MNVNLSPRQQMLAATAALLFTSGLALSHVAAQPSVPEQPVITLNAPAQPAVIDLVVNDADAPAARAVRSDNKQLICMAKVVHHEAANQPREGQIAVAHVLMNRVKRGFGEGVCDVANQPGQFFRLNRYHPNRNSETWAQALDVARMVMAGQARDFSRGALYFHANWKRPNGFFRSRTKVARLDDHDFYR